MEKLVSIDLKGDFGFFRKPDANNTVNLSYNIAHKPAILGILGAIIGLEGYNEKGKMPEYYDKLNHIGIGIAPLGHENGNFQKTVIKYSNTVGYANKGATYLTEESTLIKPAYKVYIKLNLENTEEHKLYEYLKNGLSEFIPYFGKNEHYAWWEKESFVDYEFEQKVDLQDALYIKTIFVKENIVNEHKSEPVFDWDNILNDDLPFMYFERLPLDFDEELFQYRISDCVYSTFLLKNSIGLSGLYYLNKEKCYVQLV